MAVSIPQKQIALAVASALVATSCSVLPPSLRKGEEATEQAAVSAAARTVIDTETKSATVQEPTIVPGTNLFVNPRPLRAAAPSGPEEASLNFEALDVREVAKVILGDYLRQSYTVHPAVAGTVTFRTVKPISRKDLLPTLEMLLRQNNAAVVVEEGVYKILPINAVRGSVSPQLGGIAAPLPPGFSVMVVPLQFVGAREMAKLLEPFAADNTVRVDEARNLVVIAGNQREMRHLLDTIELFDVDWLSGYSVGLFPIKSAEVKTLMADLDKVFGAAGQSPLAGIVRVIPIERMNALLIVTTQAKYLETAREWIEKFDTLGTTSGGSRFFVYQVRNGKAENLAQLVGDLFSSRRTTSTAPTLAPGSRPTELRSAPFGQQAPQPTTTTTSVTPAPGGASFQMPGTGIPGQAANEVRVIADKDTNSLLILATPSDYDVIENAIRKLDVIPRQVLVEVMLAEVLLTDNADFGIDWFITLNNNTSGSLNSGGGLPALRNGTVSPAITNALNLVQLTGSGDIRAVLNALGRDGRAQVLATPQIMVLDNQKAQIKVGNRISVQTQSQTGAGTTTGTVNSFTYLETGILLAVTPRINSGGLVTLEVNQEVSVPGETPAGNPNPNVNSRSAQTTVVVGSGETVVLGGLISEDNGRSTRGLPLLSKIPILGALFGTQSFRRSRTELVLVITPKIISDTTQAREATQELRRKLPSLAPFLPKVPKTPPHGAPPLPLEPPLAAPVPAPKAS
ncbi:MAG: type II secretion system secretin GspD [Usitatibacter sp.]